MLLQNLRKRVGARLAGNSESGFTLVELLVVMLILGILAAIAIPAFFNQKQKANDSQAKAMAHSAQVAMETYSTDNSGSYAGVTLSTLQGIEPTLTIAASTTKPYLSAPTVTSNSYSIVVNSPVTSNTFTVARSSAGALTYTCTTGGTGGCPNGGNWGS